MKVEDAEDVDVAIIGAGVAGLIAARELGRAGRSVVVLESADEVGGRVRTDVVDGLRLDRGFQLVNPSYPRVRADLDLDALRLRCFAAGAVVARERGRFVVADPRRRPRELPALLRLPGSWREKLALARWALEVGVGPVGRIKRGPDVALAERLRDHGVHGELTETVLRPFLSGVFGESEFATSRRFAELVVRSFVRGTPGVPEDGMGEIPRQLAASLAPGVVRLNTAATRVDGTSVRTDDGTVRARAVIVAADPAAAAALLDRPAPAMNALTTFYHRAARSPARRPMLHLDGERRGPLVNTAVMTDVAPGYAPGAALVASTTLGADGSAAAEARARRHAGLIYGCDPREWEHVATYAIPGALPRIAPGTPLRQPVLARDGVYVAGDHRDTASLQGAMASGRRVAAAVRAALA